MNLQTFQTALQNRILNQTAPSAGDSLGLAIYHNAYRCRLTDTLADTFERVCRLLGQEAFAQLAANFIEEHTSKHFSLAEYGSEFIEWLSQKHSQAVSNLAQIDWEMHCCFTGENASPISHLELAQLDEADWDRVIFTAAPTALIISSTQQTLDCWSDLENKHFTGANQYINDSKIKLLIWRKQLSPMMRPLEDHEVRATQDLIEGKPFALICEKLSENSTTPADQLAGTVLARWLSDELLTGYRLAEPQAD